MKRIGHDLQTLVSMADHLKQVYKASLHTGDFLVVRTCNSLYTLQVAGDGWFLISGGWFDKKGRSPMRVRINGCTWGGSAIRVNVAAACGLCLEFGNRVRTSPVQQIVLLPSGTQN